MKEQTRNTADTDRAPRGVHEEEFSAFSADLRVLCGHVFGSSQAMRRPRMQDSPVDTQVYLALKKLCRIEMNGSTRKHSTDSRNTSVHDGKSFTMRSYEKSARKPFEMCTYEILDLKSFGFCTYEKRVGGGGLARPASERI